MTSLFLNYVYYAFLFCVGSFLLALSVFFFLIVWTLISSKIQERKITKAIRNINPDTLVKWIQQQVVNKVIENIFNKDK